MKPASLLTVAIVLLISSAALAGWTVSTFSAPNSDFTYILGNSEGKQAGGAIIGGQFHAGMWNGTSDSWVDLHPSGSTYSSAQHTSGNEQVGYAFFGDSNCHAGLWNGSADSWVDLNPSGYSQSLAYGTCNGQQVGYAYDGYHCHAGLWSGNAASWVDLNPPGYSASCAYGTSDSQVVGQADSHAGYWAGTAASWTDIHPQGYTSSQASDAWNGWQVGYATQSGDNWHAALWYGTAASFVDLNPVGSTRSEVYGMFAGKQLGFVWGPITGNRGHAAMWSGTAESWLDLHSFLGSEYDYSDARQLEIVGDEMWIGGTAINTAGNDVAILWHYTPDAVPEPSSLLILGSGILALAGVIRRRNG